MMQNVYTLLCEKDIPMALITLPRILFFLVPEQRLVIVDDGSFTIQTVEKLQQLSPAITVVTRSDREDKITDAIKNYPNCTKYRNRFPLAFKLIDIPLLSSQESPRFTFTDSDIIYLKNSEGYFNQNTNTYLRTDAIKLSVKLQHVLIKYKWKVPFRFNSGYFSFDTSHFDLDFIEYYLGLPDVYSVEWLSEQTCWALLFAKAGASVCPLENQFVCREVFDGPKADTQAIHLIATLKNKVKDWSVTLPTNVAEMQPSFEPSRNVTLADWAFKTIRRVF